MDAPTSHTIDASTSCTRALARGISRRARDAPASPAALNRGRNRIVCLWLCHGQWVSSMGQRPSKVYADDCRPVLAGHATAPRVYNLLGILCVIHPRIHGRLSPPRGHACQRPIHPAESSSWAPQAATSTTSRCAIATMLRPKVVAFTATQIPGIDSRTYPADLAGDLYPEGIPIFPEQDLPRLIAEEAHRLRHLLVQRHRARRRHAQGLARARPRPGFRAARLGQDDARRRTCRSSR